MPLQKVLFKPGVNRENTRYTTEGGWYDCDKIRFRQGTPETIGGWTPLSLTTFLGVCRSMWNWITLTKQNLIGVGTNLKFYLQQGGAYYDITPLRKTVNPMTSNPFSANGTTTVTVTDVGHGCSNGDFVVFSGATGTYASDLNNEFQVLVINANSYTITTATALAAGSYGGAAVIARYQIGVGPAPAVPLVGWGAGPWGAGPWGVGVPSSTSTAIRLWNQRNFGEDLVYGPRSGGLYYWDASAGVGTRGVNLTTLGDADTPTVQNYIVVSDTSRFVLVFGTNDYGSATIDPMLIRWSAQEDPFMWTPAATNQAGSLRLSNGSEIITAVQTRQEIVVFTDSSVYSLQYLGPPAVWGSQILGDNTSIVSPNAVTIASGIIYWMGVDKFYAYDGRVQTLNCDVRRYIFGDFNQSQRAQVYCGTNEGFNEVWWFYCSANAETPDRYVIFNYLEKVWYYGTLSRTAWLDSGLLTNPVGATYDAATQTGRLVYHENGINDNTDGTTNAINAYISSSEFDIGDGHNFGFIWRVLPDLTFVNSTTSPTGDAAQVTMRLRGLYNSGSGQIDTKSAQVEEGATYVITETYNGQIYTRVRARQMIFEISSDQINTAWQLGAPRIDIRSDGRR